RCRSIARSSGTDRGPRDPDATCPSSPHASISGMGGGQAETVTAPSATSVETSEGIPVEVPPVSGGSRYLPALDGLRALAVAGVIAYHFNAHWANGGYLGVDLFFVLSG